jgi:hypothetical protein
MHEPDPACIYAQDHYGRTPLHRAAGRGHHGTVSVLKALGADVHARDNHNQVSGHPLLSLTCCQTGLLLNWRGAKPNPHRIRTPWPSPHTHTKVTCKLSMAIHHRIEHRTVLCLYGSDERSFSVCSLSCRGGGAGQQLQWPPC